MIISRSHCLYNHIFAWLLVLFGLALLSFYSCTSQKEHPLLLRADSLMNVHPDSALTILESVSSTQQLSRADKALYALLLTQARHKNFIPLSGDSLIDVAVDYYSNEPTPKSPFLLN